MLWILQLLFSPLPTPALIGLITFGITIFLWLNTKPKPILLPVDLNNQSVGTEGGGRRSVFMPEGEPVSYLFEDAKTLYEGFKRGRAESENGPCLGYRKPKQPYQWLSYQQVLDRAEYLGSGLLHKGCKPSSDQFIGIFAQNRPEWIISELACYTYSMVVVPLYETLGAEAIVYIVNKADISVVICDKPEKAEKILENCKQGKMPVLKTIILMDPFDDKLKEKGATLGIEILSFQEVEALGRGDYTKPVPPKPDNLCVVCFTSGTTGNPKGALLTHGNIVANVAAFLKLVQTAHKYKTSDSSISYLPLAHMFERTVQSALYSIGARVGFFQGDVKLLADDLKALKPSVFPVVPRVLNRIYDKEITGGKLKAIITGAAPISPSVLMFLRAVFGCHIIEAYGQTECSAACTATMPGDWKAGNVGPPLPCNIIKLEDVPEMNYFASNNEGEVCIKGPNVFKGYLKDPEKTAEALDNNGWLHTGDIGKWMPNNALKIIDRKKNIFKLSQGEYIAPEKIENIYIRGSSIAQVFVHGDSLQSFLVGIVVPDEETLPAFAENLGVKGSFEDLCKNSVVKNAILMEMNNLGKEAGLKTFEQVKYIHLHPELFTIENGFLTPTLKSKRPDLVKHFRSQIDALYASDM
ncbi:long-chain-fatty-acid--CoA ligase 5 isoform X2 [Erythrolamprus reginae]|uniref:long-chain-fatty-acid--CoA ligase 5 isoform X2 n=1 Tax=Erythrolamprus reginae TaxID=121349 RepID=UPI00396CF76C